MTSTYLAATTISACDRGPLAWCRLLWRIRHLWWLRVWWSIHLLRHRQSAILIRVLRLQSLHRGWLNGL